MQMKKTWTTFGERDMAQELNDDGRGKKFLGASKACHPQRSDKPVLHAFLWMRTVFRCPVSPNEPTNSPPRGRLTT